MVMESSTSNLQVSIILLLSTTSSVAQDYPLSATRGIFLQPGPLPARYAASALETNYVKTNTNVSEVVAAAAVALSKLRLPPEQVPKKGADFVSADVCTEKERTLKEALAKDAKVAWDASTQIIQSANCSTKADTIIHSIAALHKTAGDILSKDNKENSLLNHCLNKDEIYCKTEWLFQSTQLDASASLHEKDRIMMVQVREQAKRPLNELNAQIKDVKIIQNNKGRLKKEKKAWKMEDVADDRFIKVAEGILDAELKLVENATKHFDHFAQSGCLRKYFEVTLLHQPCKGKTTPQKTQTPAKKAVDIVRDFIKDWASGAPPILPQAQEKPHELRPIAEVKVSSDSKASAPKTGKTMRVVQDEDIVIHKQSPCEEKPCA